MLIIDSSAAMARALDQPIAPPLWQLLSTRRDQLADYDLDLSELARFVIVDPGDTMPALEAALGYPIAVNPVDGSRLGSAGFTPSWESIERHPSGWTEIVFILSDDGFGHVILVPDTDGIDAELVDLCRRYASEAAEQP
jgi:hypothetical protein